MGFFTRDRAEKVVEYHHYPEWTFISKRPRLAWWWRFLLGRPMDNVRWTNSTFWHPASRGEANRWLRLAGYQRLMIRLLLVWLGLMLFATAVLLGIGYLLVLLKGAAHPADLLLSVLKPVMLAHLVVLAPVLIFREFLAAREHGVRIPWMIREQEQEQEQPTKEELEQEETPARRIWRMVWVLDGRGAWRRDVVEPVAMALSESLDNVYREGDTDWITVPRNYLQPGGGKVEILLPTGFSGGMEAKRRVIEKTVAAKLGMLNPVFDWQVSGRHPRLLVSMPPVPPKVALFKDYRELLERCSEEYRPVLGVAAVARGEKFGELLSAEMVEASPHMALSAGSGAGKSMLLRSIIMQVLNWGWSVIILDWKAESHEWAKGLPGVKYVTRIEDIHDICERIGEEVDIRKELSKEERARRPKILVIAEEWNMTSALLTRYWDNLRTTAEPDERRSMPRRSPALTGRESLVFAGRAFGMFDLLAAQRMSNRVFNGNTDARENYMIRLMARYTPQTFKMLIPEVKPVPKPKELGRWLVWAQDEITFIQALLITDEEAREYALGGEPNALSPFSEGALDATTQRRNVGTVQGEQVASDATPPPRIARSLRELADSLESLGITYNMLRNAARSDARGDEKFPAAAGGDQFTGYLYYVDEVKEWVRVRRAAIEVSEGL
jgi:hypothetical protein